MTTLIQEHPMPRFLKSLHLAALSLGFLGTVAAAFNIVIFSILFPQVTQLLAEKPSWETYGVVAAINIIVIALYQLLSVITLLAHLIARKQTSTLVVGAITIGIISGLMVLGDITLLSDIGNEYEAGLQTRGEWMMLFASYGLHLLSLGTGMLALVRNLNQSPTSAVEPLKDEVLFLSLHSTGVICGFLGLAGVIAGIFSKIPAWMMSQAASMLSLVILSPYLAILSVWLFRRFWGESQPGLDEKQTQDLAGSGLKTLLVCLPLMAVFYRLQLSPYSNELYPVLWFPLLLFLILPLFSSLVLGSYRYS
jgi:hypothetical protein